MTDLASRLADLSTNRLALYDNGVQPPVPLWVTPDDSLLVGVRNALAGVVVSVEARIMSPAGEINSVPLTITPPADRSLAFTQRALDTGYLIAVTAQATGGTLPKRAQTYVTLGLARPPSTTFRLEWVLGSDYVSGATSVGWPSGRSVGATEGQGMLYSILGSVPAAGVDWVQTVPASARWRIRGVTATLTTSATVANRNPQLIIDDGANELFELATNNTQAASLVNVYQWIPDYPSVTFSTAVLARPIPGDMLLLAGWRLRMSTTALQVGDQWAAPRFLVEEWLED